MNSVMSAAVSIGASVKEKLGWSLTAGAMLLLAGCGGGGGSTTAESPDPIDDVQEGQVIVGLTDAEGDFASYTVDVLSISLERANGTIVETLPNTTRVDFADLTEVTELVSIATVPAGNYVSASIQLDYTESQIVVQDENGVTAEAVAVNESGEAIGEWTSRLQLASSEVIRIAPGVPAAFSLDFDLDASNEIDFSAAPPIVTVAPLLLASAELEEDREHRIRGLVDSVDVDAGSIAVDVRPFFHRQGRFGEVTVIVDDETEYEVDGEGFIGSAGLEAIAALGEDAPLVAAGMIADRQLDADVIVAGSSVPWADATAVKGTVKSRDADSLTIGGARIEFGDGTVRFAGDLVVLVGSDTSVSAPGVDSSTLSADSISVGQKLVAFGEIVDDQTLDSTAARIAMQYSRFSAEVVAAQPLVADLFLLNGRRPQAFDFTGTGSAPEFDADPDNYEVETGPMALGSLEAGDLIRVRGLVAPFGAAPADFDAKTVIDVSLRNRAGELTVRWPSDAPSAMPFMNADASAINVDISESREFLRVRGVPRAFTNGFEMLTLTPTVNGNGAYAVRVRGSQSITLFRTFEDLVDELNAQLAAGAKLASIHAGVRYTGDTETLPATRASFVFVSESDSE
ncbi:MAG: DUF4382 domain-containing protein [Pseudomonadota bacterium]